MGIRRSYSVIGAAVLLCATVTFAQSNNQTTTSTAGQVSGTDETPITLVGCIQRESDYRRQQNAGRGGVVGTGVGLGNEYVLINASAPGSTGTSTEIDCTSATSVGEAYELTGKPESELKAFVGRRVEISGMLKKADVKSDAVGTSGTTATRPTGGFDPLGQDLELFEINVMSFREAPAVAAAQAQQTVGTTGAAQTPAARADAPAAEAQAETTVAEGQDQLPRTASPVPLTGLLGLLSLAGALGFRTLRRR